MSSNLNSAANYDTNVNIEEISQTINIFIFIFISLLCWLALNSK